MCTHVCTHGAESSRHGRWPVHMSMHMHIHMFYTHGGHEFSPRSLSYVHVYAYLCACKYTHLHTWSPGALAKIAGLYTCRCKCLYTCSVRTAAMSSRQGCCPMRMSMYIYAHVYTQIYTHGVPELLPRSLACTHVDAHVYTHVCTHEGPELSSRSLAYAHVYTHVYVHVHTHS